MRIIFDRMKTEHLSLLSLDSKKEENNLGWMDSLFNWSKYISIGLGAIFAAFVIVKAWIAYQNYRNKKWQKQQTEKLKKQEEVEESLKFELFKHILCSENNKEVEQRLYYDNEECESDFNFEDSTNHSSSKWDDEECKICINSYLSENNDWDDVIRKKNYIHIHQKKIKDFINLFVQNPWNQLEKEKYVEKMGIRKSCRNFQKLYNVIMYKPPLLI